MSGADAGSLIVPAGRDFVFLDAAGQGLDRPATTELDRVIPLRR